MSEQAPEFQTVNGRKIAYLKRLPGNGGMPGLVWFNGFNSVMTSTKASALDHWARERGAGLLRFDYSGHGQSEGAFTDGTISDWLADSLEILRSHATGPQILIGSSMGGWIVLLILRAIATAARESQGLPPVAGAVLIAPAWDMTEELMWKKFPSETRTEIETQGVWHRPSRYGDGPYPITKKLIEDGRNNQIGNTPFEPPSPVRILHGLQDPDVPWRHGEALTRILLSDDLEMHLVADGEHRLSREQDIAKLFALIESLMNG